MTARAGWAVSPMNARRLCAAVVSAACACKGGGPSPEAAGPPPGPPLEVEPEPSLAIELPAQPELPPLCLLAGADAVEREDTFTDVVFAYYMQTDECRTRGLTSAMSRTQEGDWLRYLINYSHALFGCGLLFDPLPGGVGAFGPANTDAVGIPSPMLGGDDAALLVDIYLNSCTTALPLASADLAELRARLEAAAQPHIGASLSARLSECP